MNDILYIVLQLMFYVASAIVNMYCIIAFEYAIQLFDEMLERNMATALIYRLH